MDNVGEVVASVGNGEVAVARRRDGGRVAAGQVPHPSSLAPATPPCQGDPAARPISQPDGPGEAIGTSRLVGYSPEAIVDCGAFGCENGLVKFWVDEMAAKW